MHKKAARVVTEARVRQWELGRKLKKGAGETEYGAGMPKQEAGMLRGGGGVQKKGAGMQKKGAGMQRRGAGMQGKGAGRDAERSAMHSAARGTQRRQATARGVRATRPR